MSFASGMSNKMDSTKKQAKGMRLKSIEQAQDSLESVDSNFSLRVYLAKKIKKKVRANRWMRPNKKELAQMAQEKIQKKVARKKKAQERKRQETVKRKREERIAQGDVTTLIDYRDPTRKNPYTINEVRQNLKYLDAYTHKKAERQKLIDVGVALRINTKKIKRFENMTTVKNSQDSIGSQDSKLGDEPTPPHLAQPNTEKMRMERRALKKRILAQDERELRTYPDVVPFDSDISYAFDRLQMLGDKERSLPPSKLHNFLARIFRYKVFPTFWNDFFFCLLIFIQQVISLHLLVIGLLSVRLDHNLRVVADPTFNFDKLPLHQVFWSGVVVIAIGVGVLYLTVYATMAIFQWTTDQGLIKLYVYGMLTLLIISFGFSIIWAPKSNICIDAAHRNEWLGKYVKGFYTNEKHTHLRRGPTQAMITMQETIGCCGNKGYADYLSPEVASEAEDPKFPIPPSCCNLLWYENIYCARLEPSDPAFAYRVYQKGCSQRLQEYCDRIKYFLVDRFLIYTCCFTVLYLATLFLFAIHFYTLRNEAATANELELNLRNLVVREKPLPTGTIYDQLDKLEEDKKSAQQKAIEAEELIVEEDMLQMTPSMIEFLEHMQEDLGILNYPDLHRMLRLEVKRYKSIGFLHQDKEEVIAQKQFLGTKQYKIPKYLLPYAIKVVTQKKREKEYGDVKEGHLKRRLEVMKEREVKKLPQIPKHIWKWDAPTERKPPPPQYIKTLEKGLASTQRKTVAQQQREKAQAILREKERVMKIKQDAQKALEKEKERERRHRHGSITSRMSGQSRMSKMSRQPKSSPSKESYISFKTKIKSSTDAVRSGTIRSGQPRVTIVEPESSGHPKVSIVEPGSPAPRGVSMSENPKVKRAATHATIIPIEGGRTAATGGNKESDTSHLTQRLYSL